MPGLRRRCCCRQPNQPDSAGGVSVPWITNLASGLGTTALNVGVRGRASSDLAILAGALNPVLTVTGGSIAKHDLVFSNDIGGHLLRPRTSSSAGSWFVAALREAKIELLTPHDLRHTAASLAISSGANVKVVQRMLGHKSAAMTLDTYADLFDDDLDDVAERMHDRGEARATAALTAIGLVA